MKKLKKPHVLQYSLAFYFEAEPKPKAESKPKAKEKK
jgi:hypothetical protein